MNLLKDAGWQLRRLLTLGAMLGAAGIAVLLLAATVIFIVLTRPAPTPKGASTAVVNLIPAPTATPIIPTATPASTPTPTAPVPAPPAGAIAAGAYVQITGTGTDGLRLRSDPGLGGKTRLIGIEAEVFVVRDGPQDVDGYTWWYLVAPYDETRYGWAVANYLAVIQNP
jgi:hypothetical protein